MDIVCMEYGSGLETPSNIVFSAKALGSDYLEMRDGISEDSALMGRFCGNNSNIPAFLQTTQNYLRLR